MALITRIARLFRADLHNILDCLEDPEAVLKQAVREMESEIAQDEQTERQLRKGAEAFKREEAERTRELARVEEQITVAFRAGEEGLVRTFLKKKLILNKRGEQGEAEAKKLADAIETVRSGLSEKRRRMLEVQEKAKLHEAARVERERLRELRVFSKNPSGVVVTDEEVEIAFLQAKEERIAEARAE